MDNGMKDSHIDDGEPRSFSMLWLLGVVFQLWEPAAATLSYPGCEDLKPSDFQLVTVVSGAKSPLEAKIARDGRVFFVERSGVLKVFNPATKATTTLLSISVSTEDQLGLVGIALDPQFEANGWIYVSHNDPGYTTGYSQADLDQSRRNLFMNLSRFTFGNNAVNPDSRRTILRYPYLTHQHTAGSLAFDGMGNLLMSTACSTLPNGVGLDESRLDFNDLATSANTNSLLGKVLRIKPIAFQDSERPEPGPGRTYSIPAGNMAEALAAEMQWTSADREKIRPEIYAMGMRQPYSMQVDPVRNWIVTSENSPGSRGYDFTPQGNIAPGPQGRDEFNLITRPGNFGWPMFEGPNLAHNHYDYVAKKPGPMFDAAAPSNTSKHNTGLVRLPPAQPSALEYSKATIANQVPGFRDPGGAYTPITGPIYNYDGANPSRVKMPPHLNRKWIISDFYQTWLRAITLDESGKPVQVDDIQASSSANRAIDIQLGPEGALYLTNYNNGTISRLEYRGSCLPPTPVLGTHPRLARPERPIVARRVSGKLHLPDLGGGKLLHVSDITGKRMALEEAVPTGLYRLRIRNSGGREEERPLLLLD